MGTENLYVGAFNSVNEQWAETGASPWLNDSTANEVSTKNDEDWHEEFTFADHVGAETVNSVALYVEINGPSARNDFVVIDIHDGSSWSNVANQDPDGDSYVWYNYDVSTLLDTWSKINSAKLRIQYQRSGSPATQTVYVRRAYLHVDYSSVETPVLVQDSVSVSDSIGKERHFSVSDIVGVSDGLPRTDRTLSLSDAVSLLEAILKQRILQPVSDSVSVLDSVTKLREVTTVQDVVSLGDSVTRDKTVLTVSDSVTLGDAVSLLKDLLLSDTVQIADGVQISYGATQVYVYDAVQLADAVFKERKITVYDAVSMFDSIYKERSLSPVHDVLNLSDVILTDKLTTIIGDQINLVDSVRGDKTIRVSDFIYIVESVLRETWGEGWSGKIMEITNPKKVLFIEVEKIKKVLGIES